MKRLILTSASGLNLKRSGRADFVIPFSFRFCEDPALLASGISERPFTLGMHEDPERHARYKRSRLSLTALGKAVLAQTEDFIRHNPIHRWWGGTELTNDRLWRWDPTGRALIAP